MVVCEDIVYDWTCCYGDSQPLGEWLAQMTQLTKNFSLNEFIRSGYATRHSIDNTPNAEVLENLRMLALRLEGLRDILSVPIHITSGYRCPKLNSAIGGSKASAHMQGLAVDFTAPEYGSPLEICEAIMDHVAQLDYDQCINEGDWVHLSIADEPRNDVLTAHFAGGKVTYTRGLSNA